MGTEGETFPISLTKAELGATFIAMQGAIENGQMVIAKFTHFLANPKDKGRPPISDDDMVEIMEDMKQLIPEWESILDQVKEQFIIAEAEEKIPKSPLHTGNYFGGQ